MSDLISSDLDDDMKNSWGTDPLIFRAMNQEFNFGLDAAANFKNHLVDVFLTKEDDALKTDWLGTMKKFWSAQENPKNTVWINPPYGRGYIKQFMNKAIEEKQKGVTSVLLVPATLDAQWLPLNEIFEIRIVTGGRLSFYHPITNKKVNGNTKGSMFVIFRPSTMPCVFRNVDRNSLLRLGSIQLNEVE
jgi:phage N-6-adenine-methyltransferase